MPQRIQDSLTTNPAFQSRVPSSQKGIEWVTLPDKAEAVALLAHYTRLASHMHYVVTCRMCAPCWINSTTELTMESQVSMGRSSYFSPCSRRHQVSGRTTMIMLAISNRSQKLRNAPPHGPKLLCPSWSILFNFGSSSLEQVKASLILGFTMLRKEGLSARSRWLNHTATIVARELSLHVLDSSKEKGRRSESPEDEIQLEMKRRVWWHLAASDWYQPYSGFLL